MTNTQEPVHRGFIKSLIQAARSMVPSFALAGALVAIIEVIAGGIRWGFPSMMIALESTFWAAAMSSMASVVVCVPVSAMVALVYRFRPSSPEPESSLLQGLDWLLGPRGRSILVPAAIFGIGYGIGLAITRILPSLITLHNIAAIVSDIGAIVVGALVVLLVYRVFVAGRFEGLRANRAALLLMGFVYGYALILEWGQFVIPHSMVVGLVPVVLVAYLLVLEVRQKYPVSGKAARVAFVFALVGATAWIGFYSHRHAAHSFLMERTILPYGALQTLWFITDTDGDGFSSFPMGGDCAPLDAGVTPEAFEVAGNSIDENCSGGPLAEVSGLDTRVERPELTHKQNLPNVFVVVVDTLRADHVHAGVGEKPITPVLDTFSEGAVRFSHAYSPSNHTDEAVPAVFTSNYPAMWHQNAFFYGLDSNLPEVLGEVGYESIGVSCLPWAKNFTVSGFSLLDNTCGEDRNKNGDTRSDEKQALRAIEWLDTRQNPEKPLFMWVHFFDPHAPYFPNPDLVSELGSDPYVHEVAGTDAAIGTFFRGLIERGLFERSVVVVLSDHGEGLGDHWSKTHARTAYEEVARVPFIMRLPNIPATKVDNAVSTGQLFSTLTDFLGVKGLRKRNMASLMPLIVGNTQDNGPVFLESNYGSVQTVRAMVDYPYKLIFDNRKRHYLLFDLAQDPAEQVNLIDSEPERFDAMRTRLWLWWDNLFNDALLRHKAKEWDGVGVRVPPTIIGEVEFQIEQARTTP